VAGKYFREGYYLKNVTPEKVANSYEGSKQFLLSVVNQIVNQIGSGTEISTIVGIKLRLYFKLCSYTT
jgi:hypothetical protein